MTNELERTFFDTFEIEPKSVKRTLKLAMQGYDESDLPEDLKQFISSQAQVYNVYPEITDRILLELICILNQIDLDFYGEDDYFTAINYEGLKKEVIAKCKRLADKNAYSEYTGEHIKAQVQALFKE